MGDDGARGLLAMRNAGAAEFIEPLPRVAPTPLRLAAG
jgi:hypothetical protein